MDAVLKRDKIVSQEKTTYMEVLGGNRVVYRVTSTKVTQFGVEKITYGVEAEMKIGPVKFRESIDDFSDDVGQAAEIGRASCRERV